MKRTARHGWRIWGACLAALCFAPADTARAVVVSAVDQSVTAAAPAGMPGWSNMAQRAGSSAVYLGNRWAITANHVGDGAMQFTDGRTFASVPGSAQRLSNSGLPIGGTPDLLMFRLVEDPGLAPLTIAASTPTSGSNVMMIGAGRDRAPGLIGWSVSPFGGAWFEVPLPLANRVGYPLAGTKTMRWGTNAVDGGQFVISGSTLGFATRFDRPGQPFEAHAATGDSGGGVFQRIDGTWELAGLMLEIAPLGGQPANTVVAGERRRIADLSEYGAQLDDMLTRVDPPWQNPRNYFDVDGSGMLTPRDVIIVINKLIQNDIDELPPELTGSPAPGDPFYDVSGDGLVSSLDAVRMINALISGNGNQVGPTVTPAAGVSLVPEPTSGLLALVGAALLGLLRAAVRSRRRG